jgi:hypothetical protein
MTLLVFCLLAVLWGAVFIPAIVRARLDSSPIATVGMFRRGMSALGASERTFSDGRWVLVPPTPEQIFESRKRSLARHRQFLSWLFLGAVVTLAIGLLPGLHILLKAHLVIDLFVVAHLVFLVKTRRKRLTTSSQAAPVPAPASASRAATQPAQRMVMPVRRPRPSPRGRTVDLDDPVGDTREALHVFAEDEEDHRWLKAGQF